jgi:hypothetical protein
LVLPRLIAVASVALFFAYIGSPHQLIPEQTPVVGYLDDICILIFGLLAARRFTPPQLFALAGESVGSSGFRDAPAPRPAAQAAAGGVLYDLVGYRRAWRIQAALAPQIVSEAPMIIVGGSGRSGTTLLRTILNRHPAVYCGDESTVFLQRISAPAEIARRYDFDAGSVAGMLRTSRSQVEFIDAFRRTCLQRSGKSVWAEKTPDNVLRFGYIRRHFPNALLVHVIRDGRDVVCSLRRQTWLKVPAGERQTPRAVEVAIDYWSRRVRAGLRFRNDPKYIELKYEDLIRDPEAALRPVFAAAGLEWTPAVLQVAIDRDPSKPEQNAINTAALEQWRRQLSAEDKDLIEMKAGPLLRLLGY